MAIRKDSRPSTKQDPSNEPGYVTPEELERLLSESGDAIAEWEAENGPIPEDVLVEVRAKMNNARPVR